MLTRVDSYVFDLLTTNEIIGYWRDKSIAVSKSDIYVVTRRGQKRARKTTVGWTLLVKLADDSESCIPLKDIKESHPCKTTNFAKACGIAD